jgi:hypothetical protein
MLMFVCMLAVRTFAFFKIAYFTHSSQVKLNPDHDGAKFQ